MSTTRFEWDSDKDEENQIKHGVLFSLAQHAFADPKRVLAEDLVHSKSEKRFFCFGEVDGGILTVRFTYRERYHMMPPATSATLCTYCDCAGKHPMKRRT